MTPHITEDTLTDLAADIWDEGYRAGFSDGPLVCACNAWNESECACGNYGNGETPEPNPYRQDNA